MPRSRSLALALLSCVAAQLVLADVPSADAALPSLTFTSVAGLERSAFPTADARPIGVAIDPLARRLFVANSGSATLSITDMASNQVIASVPIARVPNQVVANPVTGRAYVSTFVPGSVVVVDGRSTAVLRTLPVGGLGLAVDPSGGRIFAAAGNRLAVIDAATDAVVSEVPAPAGANLWGVAAAPGGQVYLTDLFAPRVLIFDAARGAFVGEVAIDGAARFAIAASADGKRVYVASYLADGARLSVIDTGRRRVSASVPIGGLPLGLAADDARGLAYVTSFSQDTVTVLDTARGTVRATLAGGRAPAGLALDATSGRLVVANTSEASDVAHP